MQAAAHAPNSVQAANDVGMNHLPRAKAPVQKTVCQKILQISKIVFLILLALAFTLYTPTISLVCLTIGCMFSETIHRALQRIVEIWLSRPVVIVALSLISVAAVMFALPSALVVGAGLTSLHLGSQLYQWGTGNYHNQPT